MAKTELQTRETGASVEAFLNSVENDTRRNDAFTVLEMFKRVSGEEPKMWGPAIVGFGNCKYKYPDGREIDWMVTAFSPRKQNMTLYVICNSSKQPELLAKLGKHKTSKACLYINKLADVDLKILEKIVADSYKYVLKNGAGC